MLAAARKTFSVTITVVGQLYWITFDAYMLFAHIIGDIISFYRKLNDNSAKIWLQYFKKIHDSVVDIAALLGGYRYEIPAYKSPEAKQEHCKSICSPFFQLESALWHKS